MKENTSNKPLHNGGCSTYRYIKLLAACFLMVMVGCKARKQLLVKRVAADTAVKQLNDKNIRLNAIRASQNSFNTFSGKAKAKLDIAGNSNDVTLNIRINRDKKIWVSITAIAGIEVARALITPDSILIINRLQSECIKKPFSYIYKFTGKQVNYKTLECLLVGNAIPELLNENSDLQTSNGNITLAGNLDELKYILVIGPDMKVSQTNLDDQNAGQSLQVNNNTFIQVGNRVVPSQIDISSAVKDKKMQVNLHYVKVDFDQLLQYPFSIPARYNEAN